MQWIAGIFLLKIAAGSGSLGGLHVCVHRSLHGGCFQVLRRQCAHVQGAAERPLDYLRMVFGIANDTPEFRDLYYEDMNNWVRHFESNLYNDAHTIIRFNAVVRLFSFGEFHVHTVIAHSCRSRAWSACTGRL